MSSINSFREIISLWPTPAPDSMALEIGAGVSAARKWWQRDRIPAEWWRPILDADRVRAAGVTADCLATLAAREPAEAR